MRNCRTECFSLRRDILHKLSHSVVSCRLELLKVVALSSLVPFVFIARSGLFFQLVSRHLDSLFALPHSPATLQDINFPPAHLRLETKARSPLPASPSSAP